MRKRVHPLVFWPLGLVVLIGAAVLLAAPLHDALMDIGLMSRPEDPAQHNKTFLQVFRRLLLLSLAVLFLWRFRPWRGGLLRFGLRALPAEQPAHPEVVRRAGVLRLLLRYWAYPVAWLRPMLPRMRWMVVPFCTMVAVLLAVLAWQFLMGWLQWEDPLRVGKFAGRVARYTTAGLLIGCIEEWFFRGWLGEFAARKHGPRLAVVLPAIVYALVHAFRPTSLNAPVSHDASGALDALGGWLAFVTDLERFGPAAVGLFLFALLLTALYRRSGSLWPAIGAHAGAIMVLFSYGALTERDPARTWAGTRLLYDGPVVWLLLALGTWWLWPRDAARDASDSALPPAPEPGSSAQ